MRSYVLASGSEGNCTFFSYDNCNILIDMGKNAKYITECLKEIGVEASSISAILISHTHDDHITALKVFLKKNHPKVYITEKMYYDLEFLKDYDNVVIYDDDFYIDKIKVKTIKTSHDVSDSRNFILSWNEESLVYLTDTGYLNRKYFSLLENASFYLIESNHDIEMLLNGPYPKWLKNRVLGTTGHLSNKDSSFYLTKLVGDKTQKIILMHLSHTNNTEEKALETLRETFKEYELCLPPSYCAKQNCVTEVYNDQNIMSR